MAMLNNQRVMEKHPPSPPGHLGAPEPRRHEPGILQWHHRRAAEKGPRAQWAPPAVTGRVGKQAVSAYVGRVMYVICSICAIYIYCMCYTYVCIYIYMCVFIRYNRFICYVICSTHGSPNMMRFSFIRIKLMFHDPVVNPMVKHHQFS